MHYLPFYPEDERRASFCGTSMCWSWICASVCFCLSMLTSDWVYLHAYSVHCICICYTSVCREESIWPPLVRDITLWNTRLQTAEGRIDELTLSRHHFCFLDTERFSNFPQYGARCRQCQSYINMHKPVTKCDNEGCDCVGSVLSGLWPHCNNKHQMV